GLRTQPLTATSVAPPRFTEEMELDERQQTHEPVFLRPARFAGIIRMPDAKALAAEARIPVGRRRWAVDENNGKVRSPVGCEKDSYVAGIVVREDDGDVVAQTPLALDARDLAAQAGEIVMGAAF